MLQNADATVGPERVTLFDPSCSTLWNSKLLCQGTTTFCAKFPAGSSFSRDPNLQCLSACTIWHVIQYLMLWAYTLHLQHLCQFVQTTMEVVAKLHEILDVIHGREVNL